MRARNGARRASAEPIPLLPVFRREIEGKIAMNRLILAAVAAAALATPAFAQAPAPGTTATDPTETGALPDGVGEALAAIRDARANANTIADLKALEGLRLVRLSDVTRGAPPAALAAAIEAGLDDRTGLQAAMKSNPAIAERLQAESIDISTVVAGSVGEDGSVTLYLE